MEHIKLFEDFEPDAKFRENLKNPVVLQVVFSEIYIEPIVKALDNLEKNRYGDNSIDFLETLLNHSINSAAQLLGVNIKLPKSAGGSKTPTIMNSYAKTYYIDRFTQLLTYFKKFEKDIPNLK